MSVREDVMHLASQSRRLGELWRSQGEAFLQEEAERLIADVDRLRASYVAAQEAPAAVIDLRDATVAGLACTRQGHGDVAAEARCKRCRAPFCASCLVHADALHGAILCTECALVVSGVHHKRARPLVAPGRPGRPTRR